MDAGKKRHASMALGLVTTFFSTLAPAAAFDFYGFDGRLDTTLSLGASIRLANPDAELIGIANGGSARSVNGDDGNLNYESGDLIAAALKGTHDFELRKQSYGLFTRFSYFYDPVNDSNDFLGPQARDRVVADVDLLDAFLFWNTSIGSMPLDVRVGNQVVNWGESTFIQNGINVISPVDVSRLRTPGAQLREALLPIPIASLAAGLSDNLALELVYMSNWEEVIIDPRNTYFSTNDFLSEDGRRVYVGFGRRNDQHQPLAPPITQNPDDPNSPTPNPTAQVWIDRAPNVEPDDGDEYGISLRYFAPWLASTDFGFYYVNYHSRIPLVSATRGTTSNALNVDNGGGTARYYAEYPEGIELYGLSFNTDGPYGIALQGEYSYRPEAPAQLASVEILLAALGLQNNITGDQATASAVPEGTAIQGYREVKMHQVQVTGTKAFGPTFGANQMVALAEVGYNHLDLPSALLFNGPGVQLPAPGSANAAGGSFQSGGYGTQSSWGYRILTRMDFANALGAATLSPRLVLQHNVNGIGPNFNEGTKAVSVGLGLNYLQAWTADISYANFFGGRRFVGTDSQDPPAGQSASYAFNSNPSADRDFLSFNVSYAF